MSGKICLGAVCCVVVMLMVGCGVAMMLLLPQESAWVCYTQEPGSDSVSITLCPNSCYSIGGGALGIEVGGKGCADEIYSDQFCKKMDFIGVAEAHFCFCNHILCNASTSLKPAFTPLMLFLLFIFLLH